MITFECAMHHCSTMANVMLGNPYEGTPKAPSDVGTHDASSLEVFMAWLINSRDNFPVA